MGDSCYESQERMTVAIKSKDVQAFESLAAFYEVEATAVAEFTSTGMFTFSIMIQQ